MYIRKLWRPQPGIEPKVSESTYQCSDLWATEARLGRSEISDLGKSTDT